MSGLVSLALSVGGDSFLTVLVAASLVVVLAALFLALAPRTQLRERLASLDKRQAMAGLGLPRSAGRAPGMGMATGVLKNVSESLKLTRGTEAEKTGGILTQAGWRTREALAVYLGIRMLMPVMLTVVALGIAMWLNEPTMKMLLVGVLAALAGTLLPNFILGRVVKGRHGRFHKALPDVLDLLVICAEAGLGLDGALGRVAREFRRFRPEVADELALTSLELGFLPNRRDALLNLAKRVDIQSVRSLMHTLGQSERYGTPLAQALKTTAAELREERMLRAEEKAAKLPATMTVPMILFILPAVFIVLMGPAIIQVMHTFKG